MSWLLRPNNSFKPNLLRYGNGVAEKACHAVTSTTQVGLTQVLGLMIKFMAVLLTAITLLGCESSPERARVGSTQLQGCSIKLQQLRVRSCAAQKKAVRPGSSQEEMNTWVNLAAEISALNEPDCPAKFKLEPCAEP